MKKQDIQFLRKHVNSSSPARPSRELDSLILEASEQVAQVQQANNQQARVEKSKKLWWAANQFGAVSVAISITLGLLVLMQFAVQPDAALYSKYVDQSKVEDIHFVVDDASSINTILSQYSIRKPIREAITVLPPSQAERDTILKELGLPDPNTLVAQLSSEHTELVAQAEENMALAFIDIENFIEQGELDVARGRYQQLVQACHDCGLPKSLEALLIETELVFSLAFPT